MKRLLQGMSPGIRLILLGVGILGLGVAIGLVIGPRHKQPHPSAVVAGPQSPAVPSAEQVAQAPHPALPTTADAPATETSHQTVLEDEPMGPPLPDKPLQALPQTPPQTASLPPAQLPTPPKGSPPWKRFALPAPAIEGRPMIAVIIDDMGVDKKRSEKILQLPGPLTVSLMSYADDLNHLADEARRQGDELMMHLPMEPMADSVDPGPGALLTSLPPEEIRKRFAEDLDRFSGYVGINNHMGSKFTAYEAGMTLVMEELRRRGLLFVDSLTTEHSVGLELARRYGIPTAGRNVFLDNSGDLASVEGQLARTEEVARKKGSAIAIGHPRDATIQALAGWLPTLEKKGFVLVPVTAVVRARMADKSATTLSSASHRGE